MPLALAYPFPYSVDKGEQVRLPMISNRSRRRISEQQRQILFRLLDGPEPALDLAVYDLYSRSSTDRKVQTKSIKRALRGLESWQLVRLFMAPHPDADMSFGNYLDEMRARAKRRGVKDGPMLSISYLRMTSATGRIAPSGNRKQATLWAEITDLGREYLQSSQRGW